MKNFLVIALIILCTLTSCSPIRYRTLYDSVEDPTFDFSSVKTIGFMSLYWTETGKKNNVDELAEKQIFAYLRNEFEKRDYKLSYISKEYLVSEDGHIYPHNMENFPDLVLLVGFRQSQGNVNVPAQSFGGINWGGGGGSGTYGKTSSYDVTVYDLNIKFVLWAGKPMYPQKVWSGDILKGSPVPNLNDKAEMMIRSLFFKKFKHRSKISSP